MSTPPRDENGQFMSPDQGSSQIGLFVAIALSVLAVAVFTPLSPINATIITGMVSGSILGGAGFDAFLQLGGHFGFFAAIPSIPVEVASAVGAFLIDAGATQVGAIGGATLSIIVVLGRRT